MAVWETPDWLPFVGKAYLRTCLGETGSGTNSRHIIIIIVDSEAMHE